MGVNWFAREMVVDSGLEGNTLLLVALKQHSDLTTPQSTRKLLFYSPRLLNGDCFVHTA